MNLSGFKSFAAYAVAATAVGAITAFAPGLIGSFVNTQPAPVVKGIMPACNSKLVRELLIRAVHQSPSAQESGLRSDVEDYAKDAAPRTDPSPVDIRFCKAVAFTNAGQGDLHFVLKWLNAKKDQVWLDITLSTI